MVGGTVIEVLRLKKPEGADVAPLLWINVRDGNTSSECALCVVRSALSDQIKVGDDLWWQGVEAFWNPKQIDIPIQRFGYSGRARPGVDEIEDAGFTVEEALPVPSELLPAVPTHLPHSPTATEEAMAQVKQMEEVAAKIAGEGDEPKLRDFTVVDFGGWDMASPTACDLTKTFVGVVTNKPASSAVSRGVRGNDAPPSAETIATRVLTEKIAALELEAQAQRGEIRELRASKERIAAQNFSAIARAAEQIDSLENALVIVQRLCHYDKSVVGVVNRALQDLSVFKATGASNNNGVDGELKAGMVGDAIGAHLPDGCIGQGILRIEGGETSLYEIAEKWAGGIGGL